MLVGLVFHCGPSVGFTYFSDNAIIRESIQRLRSTPAFRTISVMSSLCPPSGKFDLAQPQLILHQLLTLNLLPSRDYSQCLRFMFRRFQPAWR